MAREFTAASKERLYQLEQDAPFLWLFEANVPETPDPRAFRLTNFTDRIAHGSDPETGNPFYFYPADIIHGDLVEAGDGSLPTMSVRLGLSTTEFGPYLARHKGLKGQAITITLINSEELPDTSAGQSVQAKIIDSKIARDTAAFTLGSFSPFQLEFPPHRYSRLRCRHIFGDVYCGFQVGVGGATLTECPGYTVEACEEVGVEEAARGITGLHPRRFGAQKGIPTRSRV